MLSKATSSLLWAREHIILILLVGTISTLCNLMIHVTACDFLNFIFRCMYGKVSEVIPITGEKPAHEKQVVNFTVRCVVAEVTITSGAQ